MKRKYSEEKALKKLDIPGFGYMTKDKIATFSSILPHMDPDVAKKALEQFPTFKDFASELVGQFKDTIDEILNKNTESEAEFYNACNEILSSLQEELRRDDIDASERERIEIRMIDVATMIGEKDRESKNFKIIIGVVFGLAVTALGGIAIAALALNRKESEHDMDVDYVYIDVDDIEVDVDDVPVVELDG